VKLLLVIRLAVRLLPFSYLVDELFNPDAEVLPDGDIKVKPVCSEDIFLSPERLFGFTLAAELLLGVGFGHYTSTVLSQCGCR